MSPEIISPRQGQLSQFEQNDLMEEAIKHMTTILRKISCQRIRHFPNAMFYSRSPQKKSTTRTSVRISKIDSRANTHNKTQTPPKKHETANETKYTGNTTNTNKQHQTENTKQQHRHNNNENI